MLKRLNYFVLLLLTAVIIWWFARGINWADVGQALRQADWRLLAVAVGASCLVYVLSASRCRALLVPFAVLRWRDVFIANVLGISAIFLLGRAGEGVRALMITLRDRRVPPSAALVTVVLERLCDLCVVMALFACNLLWLRPPAGRESVFAHVRAGGLLLLMGLLAGLACLVLFKRHAPTVLAWLARRGPRRPAPLAYIKRIVSRVLEQLANALRLFTDARELGVVVGWTLLLWGTNCSAIWLVLRAFGLRLGISATIFVMGLTLVGSLMPTPGGGAGAYHAAAAAGLVLLGVPRELAAAAVIVLHLIAYTPALLLASYFAARDRVSQARLRRTLGAVPLEDKTGVLDLTQ